MTTRGTNALKCGPPHLFLYKFFIAASYCSTKIGSCNSALAILRPRFAPLWLRRYRSRLILRHAYIFHPRLLRCGENQLLFNDFDVIITTKIAAARTLPLSFTSCARFSLDFLLAFVTHSWHSTIESSTLPLPKPRAWNRYGEDLAFLLIAMGVSQFARHRSP